MSGKHDVLLINMPFSYFLSPSIGLGLLKASLTRNQIDSKVLYLNIKFAELIGQDDYLRVLSGTFTEDLAGEWVFSDSLFKDGSASDIESYLNNVLRAQPLSTLAPQKYEDPVLIQIEKSILRVRDQVEEFLEGSLETVCSYNPRIIGFTSLFHQHVASLSLARRIKARLPDSFIIFGGPNCEGVMGRETLNQFKFIDAVVSGEGDHVFPEIVQRILNEKRVLKQQGVFMRTGSAPQLLDEAPGNTALVRDLDNLPIPDYDDYFQELSQSSMELRRKPGLLFETSRGCWWGEKHHCTFCGLNGGNMAFRSKSAKRALGELLYLTDRYPGCSINVVDNILDMNYFKDFIPLLAERKQKLNLFYEVKANLKKEQLRLLRAAGIRAIQPGIESFSDNVLETMRKGVSGLQNIQLLKWCRELGLDVYYHLIWGFPGETAEDYLEMAKLIPLITHLQPPMVGSIIRIDRFSPNFDQAEQLGFSNLSPHPAYGYVYPLKPAALTNLAYFFTFEYGEQRNVVEYVKPVAAGIKQWKDSYQKSDLFWMDKGQRLLIWDLRPMARKPLTVLSGYRKFCYMACDQIMTARQVFGLWQKNSTESLDETSVEDLLDEFTDLGLMIKSKNSYLALALASRVLRSRSGRQPDH